MPFSNSSSMDRLWNNSQKQHSAILNAAQDMPGYGSFGGGGYGGLPQQSYLQQYQDAVNPADFLSQLGLVGGGDGGFGDYGPIGADELKQFGEGAYELFDQFRPGMEYIAENQGVGEQELANMLGTSSSGFAQNVANQDAQQARQYGRMGIDPTSGAYAAGEGGRAMQNAAGLSGLQQNVRSDARNQDWSERMQAAGIGLQAGQAGTDALGKATGAYSNAMNQMGDMYGQYMGGVGQMLGLDEQASQFGDSMGLQRAQHRAGSYGAAANSALGRGITAWTPASYGGAGYGGTTGNQWAGGY